MRKVINFVRHYPSMMFLPGFLEFVGLTSTFQLTYGIREVILQCIAGIRVLIALRLWKKESDNYEKRDA